MRRRLVGATVLLVLAPVAVWVSPTAHADQFLTGSVNLTSLTVPGGQVYELDPNATTTVTLTGNLVVNGTLRSRPAHAGVVHTIRFVDINESRFVGGGMDPVASDVGLWVMGAGRLDMVGAAKTGWTQAAGAVAAGATVLEVRDATGWRAGDEITIAPTGLGDYDGFEQRIIAGVAGNRVTLTAAVSRGHPSVNANGNTYTAEVANLTRNVRIEGTPPGDALGSTGHRTHVFIRNTSPVVQTLDYVGIRYVGPRKDGQAVLGRYGLHIHMSHHNNHGTVVRGTVIRDSGSHGFVPHMSDGITFRDTVAFRTMRDAYTWDLPPGTCTYGRKPACPEPTNDIVYDHALAAWVNAEENQYRVTGFALNHGERNVVRNSTAVGVGGSVDSSGFGWLEGVIESVWGFDGNTAHNNRTNGIFWWQVDEPAHVVTNFHAYRNGLNGIDHGAYRTCARYSGVSLYQDGHRVSDDAVHGGANLTLTSNSACYTPDRQLLFEDIKLDGGGVSPANLLIFFKVATDDARTILRRVTAVNWKTAPVIIDDDGEDTVNDGWSNIDLVCWRVGPTGRDLEPGDFARKSMDDRSVIRVQRANGTAYQLTGPNAAVSTIPKFADCGGTPAPVVFESLGGLIHDRPAGASWSSGRMDVVARGADGAVYHNWTDGVPPLTPTSAWAGWESLGGVAGAGPAVSAWGPGRLDVFVPGTDGAVYHRSYNGGWSPWESLGGQTHVDVASASWASGRLDLFVRGLDNALWHRWYDRGWSNWESLGGGLNAGPAVASRGPGQLDVVVTGLDNSLWHRRYDRGWSNWESLGGQTRYPPGAAAANGQLTVIATGFDNQLWVRRWNLGWSGWTPIGGQVTSGPGATTRAGFAHIFARGLDNATWHRALIP